MSNSTIQTESFIKLFNNEQNLSVKNHLDVRKQQYNCSLMFHLLNSGFITTNEMESMFNVVQLNDIETNYRTISKSYWFSFKNVTRQSRIMRSYVFSTLVKSITNDEKLNLIYKMKEQTLIVFFNDDEVDILERELN